MRIKLKEFDPSAYLDNDEVIAEYLTAALEDGNPDPDPHDRKQAESGDGHCEGRDPVESPAQGVVTGCSLLGHKKACYQRCSQYAAALLTAD